jgi:hypothetical protein
MEHDRREGRHIHLGYQTQTAANEHCHRGCPLGVTPPRASDSDFIEERPPRKTLLQRPHEACVGLCQTDDSSQRRLAAPIPTVSSEEEICKTRAQEDHHSRTTRHRASSPQVQLHPNSDFTVGEDQLEGPSDTPEQEPITKVIAAIKPWLISIVFAAQATMRKPLIAGHQQQCRMRPAHRYLNGLKFIHILICDLSLQKIRRVPKYWKLYIKLG